MPLFALAPALVLSPVLLFSTLAVAADPAPRLEQVWLSEGFSSPEGVAVDGDTLLISNVAGDATAKDGNGWISRVSMQGQILEEKWVEGFNAPKGMALHNGLLYVSDIDSFHIVKIKTGKLISSFVVPGAGFLNDVTVWNGAVYVSDSSRKSIYKLDEEGSQPWLTAPILNGVNGILARGDRLLASTMADGLLLSISATGIIEKLAEGMTNADGIADLGDGNTLVSSWTGTIWHVGADGGVSSILDTQSEDINQNDLTGVGDLIIVPNWSPGTVTAWRVVHTAQ
jgi:hypothetical protein